MNKVFAVPVIYVDSIRWADECVDTQILSPSMRKHLDCDDRCLEFPNVHVLSRTFYDQNEGLTGRMSVLGHVGAWPIFDDDSASTVFCKACCLKP